jgi:hypothetical protein
MDMLSNEGENWLHGIDDKLVGMSGIVCEEYVE